MDLESDRLLRIEIWEGVPKPNLESEDFMNTVVQWVKEDAEKENDVDAHTNSEKQYSIWKKPKRSTNVFVGYDDEEQEEIMETSDEESFESSSSEDSEESDSYEYIFESNSNKDMEESNSNDYESNSNDGIVESNSDEEIDESNSDEEIVESNSDEEIDESNSDEEIDESNSDEEIDESNSDEDIDQSNSDEDIDESNSKGSTIVCVKSIHINSLILAEKSLFFSKLFSNETRGSEHRNVTIRIHVSEEAALMHLLSFICTNTLSTPTSLYGLVEVIRVADKYKVSSCMKYCSKSLLCIKMTPMVAVVFLKFPFTVRMVEGVQPVVDAATQYLTGYFNNFEKLEELMILPLHGIEVVLSSNDLQIPNEDIVYEFLTNWVAFHYSEPDKRRRIMNKRLSKLMRFHYMSFETLRNILACPNFDSSVSSKFVLEALFFQSESSRNQCALIAAGDFSVKRAYIQFPSRMVEFQLPIP